MDPIFRLMYCSEQYPKNSSSNYSMMMLSKNMDKISDLTIEEIAELCNTNPMAISRTVRKLGYKSFADFRSATQETVNQYKYINRNIPMEHVNSKAPAESFLDYIALITDHLRNGNYINEINHVCDAIKSAEHFHYYGPPFNSISIVMFLHDLIVDNKDIHPYTSSDSILLDLNEINENSIVMLVPNEFSINTNLTHKIMDTAEEKKAQLIIHIEDGNPLLSFTKGPNLTYPGDHTAASVISSNFILNMMTMTYRSKYIDK